MPTPAEKGRRSHPDSRASRFTLLGVGAMDSPRFAPAGLLVEHGAIRVAIDGGPGAEPPDHLEAWLVTDLHAELISPLRRLAGVRGLRPEVACYAAVGITIEPHPVDHTPMPPSAISSSPMAGGWCGHQSSSPSPAGRQEPT